MCVKGGQRVNCVLRRGTGDELCEDRGERGRIVY